MKHVVSKDGTRIAIVNQGLGAHLILVGGALQTKEDHLFRRLIPLLADDFSVVSYDRRGRGDSDNTPVASVEREIEDLEAVIASVGGPVFLFGNSSGAQLALATAVKNSRVSKVAVYEAPFIPERPLGSAAQYEQKLRQSLAEGAFDRTLKLFFSRVGVPRPVAFVMRFLPMWKGLKKLAPTLLSDALLVGDGSIPQGFRSMAVRTLALSGSSSAMIEAAKSLSAVIPGSGSKVLRGQTHAVDPAVLARELRLFFRD